MQPIHYSLILNLAILAVLGWLSYAFASPLLIIIGLLLANHTIARFGKNDGDEDDSDDDNEKEPAIGFGANIR